MSQNTAKKNITLVNKIIKLVKTSFTVYYSIKYKYPICVVEPMDGLRDVGIDRESLNEPFKQDPSIPVQHSATIEQYHDYMQYGGSYGHNAPAGFHKSTIENYTDTFLLSNICPQEVVFNSGLWRVLETWHKALVKKYKKVTILTGSIGGVEKIYNKTTMYVPTHMYKLAIVHADKNYITAHLMSNKPCGYDDISKYIIHPGVLRDLVKSTTKFDLYDATTIPIQTIKNCISELELVGVPLTPSIDKAMKSSLLYGKIVYAKTLQELEHHYNHGQSCNLINHYHTLYFNMAKQRLERNISTSTYQ